jgi:hypothetical protein
VEHAYRRCETDTIFWPENLMGIDHFVDLGLDGRMII